MSEARHRAPHPHRRAGLLGAAVWRNASFRRLWVGDTVSQLGSAVTVLVLPLIAVRVVHASAGQIGLLMAGQTLPFLLIGLPAGAWVDRLSRRRVLIVTDVIRGLALLSIPIVAAVEHLMFLQLVVVGFVAGCARVFFDVAYQSFLPEIVSEQDLVDGNAGLQASQSVSEVAGPAVGGALAQLVTAPWALALDAVSFIWSAVWIGAIPEPPRPEPDEEAVRTRGSLRRQISEGLSFVLGHNVLRPIVITTALSNVAAAMATSLAVVFLVRVLGLASGEIGVLLAAGGIGGTLGAFAAGPLAERLGRGPAIWVPITVVAPFAFLVPFLTRSTAPLYALTEAVLVFGVVAYNVGQVSLRQTLCPPQLRGRMNATVRFLVWGAIPIGSLIGGGLGEAIGVRQTLIASAVVQVVACVPVLLSPLRRRSFDAGPAAVPA